MHVDVRWEGPWIFDEWRSEWRLRWLDARGGKSVIPLDQAHWRVGPFPVHILDPERLEIRLIGDGPVLLEEAMSGLEVFGPWQVVIRSVPTDPARRVLSTWKVHWVRVEPGHVERWWTSLERRRVGAWTRTTITGGASEARALVEGGASELWRIGASERSAIGASEWLAFGASETLATGASEWVFGGASALLYGMSSARLGASEWISGSAQYALGGSEGGGRHEPFGASERWSDVVFQKGGE
jgi:hypothetical protein